MALIPPFFLDCVVAIGFDAAKGERNYVATGFLYGDFLKREGEDRFYYLFLVTNKHVFEGAEAAWLRFNPEGDELARELSVRLLNADKKPIWFAHHDPEVDLAVIGLNARVLQESKIRVSFFRSDTDIADRKKALEVGISEGDGVFALGFPMGLIGEKRNFVIVRQGAIARIRDALAGIAKEFLIDTSIFPGNSGGPVISRPEVVSIEGTKAVSSAYLLGVVSSYIPYTDVAISPQTKRPRVTFEENSGLAAAVPIDYLVEIIGLALTTLKERKEEALVEPTQSIPEKPTT